MKKRLYILLILLLIIATGIGIFFVVRDKKNKKIEEENKELALLYYRQNTAFGLCGDIGKRYYYHGEEANKLRDRMVEEDKIMPSQIDAMNIDELEAYLMESYD